jgi:hypothetical protein
MRFSGFVVVIGDNANSSESGWQFAGREGVAPMLSAGSGS